MDRVREPVWPSRPLTGCRYRQAMPDTVKAPPAWLIAGIGRVRQVLDLARRSTVPANAALLELAQGDGAALDAAGVTERCTVTGGSFVEAVPDGADAYLLKTIIPDWDDEESLTILRNIRTAIATDGKLLLMELVLPEAAPPHPGMLVDLEMLVHTGGRERTASEYADLLSRAGFRQTRVIPAAGPMSLVEAVPAQS
jgi:hypothetical protein